MALVQGISHVSILTSDLDRAVAFYCDVFRAELVQLEATPYGGRIGIVRIGLGGAALNIFEVSDNAHTAGSSQILHRGHIDHFGIAVGDAGSFWSLRDQVVVAGQSTGDVMDFGPVIGFDVTDPDGMIVEVNLVIDPALGGGHEPRPYEVPALQ